ncbi:MAG: epoxide hydrolase family protein [Alphaproteobacteria bacterium]
MTPFTLDIPQAEIDRIWGRVRNFEFFSEPDDTDPTEWQYGTQTDYMRELCAYWADGFDWPTAEAGLNRFPMFTAEVDGINIHFVHEKGSGANPTPLILLHGWPGSYFEFMDCVERLAHPERFGGDAEDGCDVIVPSLVGYGYSGKPPRPLDPRGQAAHMRQLMTEVLGYDSYVAQGGDWGSSIVAWLGFDDGADKGGACRAIHLNMFGLRAGGDFVGRFGGPGVAKLETDEEKAWARDAAVRIADEMGYQAIQRTKPQTLSFGMMDSPVGTAAWIIEKFHRWSDRREGPHPAGHIENALTKDQLLTNAMIYITGKCFHTAAWQYRSLAGNPNSVLPKGQKIMVPTAFAEFPGELAPLPPRSYIEKAYDNVVQITHQIRGGHFAALEQPELFVNDVQGFFRTLA